MSETKQWVVAWHVKAVGTGFLQGAASGFEVVSAEDPDAAARAATRKLSVLWLERGTDLTVFCVDDEGLRYRAKYFNPGGDNGMCDPHGRPSDLRIERDEWVAVDA